MSWADVDALLAAGVRDGVFPTARAHVLHRGATVFSGGPAPATAVFDLASVTKVMSTTALAAFAVDQGALSLEHPLRRFFPDAAAGEATVRDLLLHRAGLPPYRTYFGDCMNSWPALFDDAPHRLLRAEVRSALLRRHVLEPATAPIGQAAVYSDIGFILLGAVLEQVLGAPLDVLFDVHVARPLGLLHASYRRLSARPPARDVVPTQDQRPREPAPGQEGLWSVAPRPTVPGDVDDDNAWCLDGVSGHAGLFATAEDVARFGQAVLDGRVRFPEPWAVDPRTSGSTRTLGFDTPSKDAASCGPRFGPRAIGHLGFTGTSLWIDLDRQLVVVLLTNRTALGRANLRIRELRPRFHDAVLDAS